MTVANKFLNVSNRVKVDLQNELNLIFMMTRLISFSTLLVILLISACSSGHHSHEHTHTDTHQKVLIQYSDAKYPFLHHLTYDELKDTLFTDVVELSDAEWRKVLTSAQYRILRNEGTELPYRNEYNSVYKDGIYTCAACGNPLFHSDTKYDSRTGWPSFWEPIHAEALGEKIDRSFFMTRIETHCARCKSHIGHVFDDGPAPTGLRYCMNSAAMRLVEKK
jgi:peptide-methionine (R)-S-oxide reductase